jgi:hypothetical protein
MLEASVYRADAGAECSGKPCRSRAELVVGPVSQEGCAVEDLLAEVDGIVARLDDPIVERAMDRSRADALGRLEKGDVAGARAAAERALERARRLDTQARSVNVAAAILATLGVVAIAYVWLNRERKKAASIF